MAAALRSWGWEADYLDCLDRFHPRLAEFLGGKLPRRDTFGRGQFPQEETEKPPAVREVAKRYFRHGIPLPLFRAETDKLCRPDLILVGSTMTYWYPGYFLAICLIREAFPGTPVILGGLYPRLCPEHARKFSGADFIHGAGLGELGVLLRKLGFPADGIDGDLDVLPAFDLLSDRSALPLLTGRGCPFSCSYCAAPFLEPDLRRRDPGKVVEEIAGYISRYGTSDFAFYDNALLYRAEDHLDLILEKSIRRGLLCRFHTPNGLHARFLTEKTARLMKESGFATVRLSLETSNSERQRRSGGKVGNTDLERALGFLERAGYPRREIGVYVLFGLPDQPLEEAAEAASFVQSLGAHVYLAEYSPIPGTPDYHRLVREGVIEADLDPLWHNNSIFYLRRTGYSLEAVRELRRRVNELNRSNQ
ncbi:MAG: B12-binding domain-containing radical SAM protein [Candidatus Aureabacteria bacterium]|nr:B12-binding domain-containing radical SAM protein [Candidatus Auribacterota bacterium]